MNSALRFAIEGSEAVLNVGAPQGAEEILSAILQLDPNLRSTCKLPLLLARALIDQAKAERALPIIEELAHKTTLSLHEQAEVAMMRASAEFLLSRGLGPKYCDAARSALAAATLTRDPQLIARALFECARAGTEEGMIEMLQSAEQGTDELAETCDIERIPMAILTKAYCRFFLGDPKEARSRLQQVIALDDLNVNSAQRALIHSGLGIANHMLGLLDEAHDQYSIALELTRKIGDDSRVCTVAANLCTVQMNRGDYDDAIRYGEMSVAHGEACSSSSLLVAYTNLIDPYMLVGRESAAMTCLEKATKWIGPERRWKLRLTFLVEASSFALMQRNVGLAVDLIGQLEGVAGGREIAIPMPGSYWKVKAFRMAQLGRAQDAYELASSLTDRWKNRCVFPYLEMIATKAWLERRIEGSIRRETLEDLSLFEQIGALGKRQLLVLQGFLEPMDTSASNAIGTSIRSSAPSGKTRIRASAPPAHFHTE